MQDIGGEQPTLPIQPSQKPYQPMGSPISSGASPKDSLSPRENEQGPEQGLNELEWARLLDLGKKPTLDLMENPQELAEFQSLNQKGDRLFGEKFREELSRRRKESQKAEHETIQQAFKEDQKRREGLVTKAEEEADRSIKDARGILTDFDQRSKQRQVEADRQVEAIREKMGKPNNPLDAPTDPKVLQAKTELTWIQALTGQEIPGLDTELKRKILEFKQGGTERIFKDPEGYQDELDKLKAEFFKSQGVELKK